MLQRPTGTLVLFTDFSPADPRLGLLRGQMLQRHPKALLVDLAHGPVAAHPAASARWLQLAVGRLPAGATLVAGTAHGTNERLLAAAAQGCFWFAADDGRLTEVVAAAGQPELRLLDLEHLGLRSAAGPCADLELLAAAAGLLASGRYGFSALGPRTELQQRLPVPPPGQASVIQVADDGSLTLGIAANTLAAGTLLQVGARQVPYTGLPYTGLPDTGSVAAPAGSGLVAVAGAFGLVEVRHRAAGAGAKLAALGDPVVILNAAGNA